MNKAKGEKAMVVNAAANTNRIPLVLGFKIFDCGARVSIKSARAPRLMTASVFLSLQFRGTQLHAEALPRDAIGEPKQFPVALNYF